MYEPEFADFEVMIQSFLKSNYWRVSRFMEWEDAYQEACYKYAITKKRALNKGIVFENKAHFAQYFRKSMTLHFHTLSNENTLIKNELMECDLIGDEEESSAFFEVVGDLENLGIFEYFLEKAPSEVKEVLNLLFNTPSELLDKYLKTYNNLTGKKTASVVSDSFLCFILGYDENTNLLEKIKKYLTN